MRKNSLKLNNFSSPFIYLVTFSCSCFSKCITKRKNVRALWPIALKDLLLLKLFLLCSLLNCPEASRTQSSRGKSLISQVKRFVRGQPQVINLDIPLFAIRLVSFENYSKFIIFLINNMFAKAEYFLLINFIVIS